MSKPIVIVDPRTMDSFGGVQPTQFVAELVEVSHGCGHDQCNRKVSRSGAVSWDCINGPDYGLDDIRYCPFCGLELEAAYQDAIAERQ